MEIGKTQEVSTAAETQAAAITQESTNNASSTQSSVSGDFRDSLLKVLGMSEADTINEEELFAGVIEQRQESGEAPIVISAPDFVS